MNRDIISSMEVKLPEKNDEPDWKYISELLKIGVYVELDNFGKEYYVDREVRNAGYGLFVNDVQRVQCLKQLIDEGYKSQILLSCDVCLKICLRTYGGWGYDHVLKNIVPMMEDFGISRKDIQTIIRDNPVRMLERG